MTKFEHIQHRVEILDKLKELGFEEITTYASGKRTEPETSYLLWKPDTDLRVVVGHILGSKPTCVPVTIMTQGYSGGSLSGWHNPNLASLYDAHDILATIKIYFQHPPFDGDNFLKYV